MYLFVLLALATFIWIQSPPVEEDRHAVKRPDTSDDYE